MDLKVEAQFALVRAALGRLELKEKTIMAQIDDMDVLLQSVADNETKLGVDIQAVIDFLKSHPSPTPTDLTAQLAKLGMISQALIDTDAATLANLPPVP